MEALADRWRIAAAAKGIADDPDHPMWMAVGKFAHEATKGKPAQTVAATVQGEVTVKFVTE